MKNNLPVWLYRYRVPPVVAVAFAAAPAPDITSVMRRKQGKKEVKKKKKRERINRSSVVSQSGVVV